MNIRQIVCTVLLLTSGFCALGGEIPRKVVGQKQVDISYRVSENLSGIKSVELWITTDGGRNWQMWGRDDDVVPPITFQASQDGEYGIIIISTDKAGNREASPTSGTQPEAVLIVDTTPPAVRITSPSGGEVFSSGANLQVQWVATDANLGDKCVDVQMSSDGGQTWRNAAQGLPNTGNALIPLPGAAMERYTVKVRVTDQSGNSGQAVLGSPIILDGQAPRASLLGPKVSPSSRIQVTYEAEDVGGAGLAEILLWYTTDGGLTWKLFGKDPDLTSPIEFDAAGAGSYGFFIQAKDRAGNSSPAPKQGIRPDLVTVIDNAPPSVELLSFHNGGAYRGGDTYEIRWNAEDDNMADRPITLEYTTDGGRTWNIIARSEPNDGSFAWTLPRSDTGAVIVRVTAADNLGNTAAAQSAVPFTVDSTPPRSMIAFGTEEPVMRPQPSPRPSPQPLPQPSPQPSTEEPSPAAVSVTSEKLDSIEKWIASGDRDKRSEALAELDKIINEQPTNSRAYYLRGRWYYNQRNYTVARKQFEEAVSINPNQGEYHFWLGRTLVARARASWKSDKQRAGEDASMAVAYLDRALGTHMETGRVYLWNGIAYFLAAKYNKDAAKYETAVDRLSKSIDLAVTTGAPSEQIGVTYFWRAEVRENMGDLKSALEDYERAADTYGPRHRHGVLAEKRAVEVRSRLRGVR